MGQILYRVLLLSIALFFSGLLFGQEAVIAYLYYVHDTGITFTGSIVADILLSAAGAVGFIYSGRELYQLHVVLRIAKQKAKENNG